MPQRTQMKATSQRRRWERTACRPGQEAAGRPSKAAGPKQPAGPRLNHAPKDAGKASFRASEPSLASTSQLSACGRHQLQTRGGPRPRTRVGRDTEGRFVSCGEGRVRRPRRLLWFEKKKTKTLAPSQTGGTQTPGNRLLVSQFHLKAGANAMDGYR